MRRQKTFEGLSADILALAWVRNIATAFELTSANIKKMPQPYNWRGDRYRAEVNFK